MSDFDALPEDQQEFILDQIKTHTLLDDDTIKNLLNNGWSYTEDGDGHRWHLSALDRSQTARLEADWIAIPEILLPPAGIPINANAVQQLYDLLQKPKGEQTSVEHQILMAMLRSVYQGYKQREDAAKAEQDAEIKND